VCTRVGSYLRHKHRFASYHHIISHSIISYIILHQQKAMEKENCSFENTCWIMKECVGTQNMPSADILLHKKGIFVSNRGKIRTIESTERKSFFFVKHEKKGRYFFANSSKRVCMKVSCITKKYITSIYTHCLQVFLARLEIMFNDIKLAKIKVLVFPSGPSRQLRLTAC
jgi:hypothetical protein